jgi:hypothetical protein
MQELESSLSVSAAAEFEALTRRSRRRLDLKLGRRAASRT